MWSQETKQGLLESRAAAHADRLVQLLGGGRHGPLGHHRGRRRCRPAKFQLSDTTRLFDENLQPIEAKPGTKGLVGVGGRAAGRLLQGSGEERAHIRRDADGGRFSVPGDWAEVNEDGKTLTLLGRGSVCINTGGEKVFPEEVEEVVKRAAGVRDCVVVGVPDERFGEAITAVVSSIGTARRARR